MNVTELKRMIELNKVDLGYLGEHIKLSHLYYIIEGLIEEAPKDKYRIMYRSSNTNVWVDNIMNKTYTKDEIDKSLEERSKHSSRKVIEYRRGEYLSYNLSDNTFYELKVEKV